ncbi:META domain-containing protein [Algoriphagus hitonicola]|uniref:META domain-containing protein n=1 Tax=Algoriphagus hitonicola TaxID=435880 RepID=A0A1I2UWQ4_9BACT|nr:META domain-containing protein [Algoriphagus hitonicola]SFG80267.1 META domain-containing protein [Algoriphagus hitonicola]
MKYLRIISFGLLIFIYGGCDSSKNLSPIGLLTGNTWALSSLLGQGLNLSEFSGGVPTLNFLEEGRLAGFTSCNNFSGGFLLEGTTLELDPGAMTKKACPGDGEQDFLEALGRVANLQISKDKLTLLDGSTELMTFLPK